MERQLTSMNNLCDALPLGLADWFRNASIADISLCIELGHPMLNRAKALIDNAASAIPSGIATIAPQPVEKGQTGEAKVRAILLDKFPQLVNTSKNPKSGDMSLHVGNHRILIEVKNYGKSSVSSAAVDKFRRDIHEMRSRAGLFISLNSPIAKFTSTFNIIYEKSESGTSSIPCIYLISDDPAIIRCAADILTDILASADYILERRAMSDPGPILLDSVTSLSNIRATLLSHHTESSRHIISLLAKLNIVEVSLDNMFVQIASGGMPTAGDDLATALTGNKLFINYSTNYKESILSTMILIAPDGWCIQTKKATNNDTCVHFRVKLASIELLTSAICDLHAFTEALYYGDVPYTLGGNRITVDILPGLHAILVANIAK